VYIASQIPIGVSRVQIKDFPIPEKFIQSIWKEVAEKGREG
jgi:hypothetical protein